jgi:uncharacterized membrane protein
MDTEEKISTVNKTTTVQTVFRLLLASFLLLVGIGHVSWARVEFLAQVPKWVPLNKDLVVVLSGVVEILLGSSLILLTKYRTKVGWVIAIFFVLVFPGNISQFVNGIDAFGLNSDLKRGIRLLFQPLLVIWVLWSTDAWGAWRRSRAL